MYGKTLKGLAPANRRKSLANMPSMQAALEATRRRLQGGVAN
jgi:hypothetical protein